MFHVMGYGDCLHVHRSLQKTHMIMSKTTLKSGALRTSSAECAKLWRARIALVLE